MANQPPPDIKEAADRVQAWLDSEEAAEREAANRGPSAVERFNDIRRAQYAAGQEGRTLAIPPAPEPAPAQPDPARMSASERWTHMRSHDQSKMPAWNPNRQ
jgi:hypothetical protein